MIGVEVQGADSVRKALLQLVQHTRARAKTEVRKAAISTASKAKQAAPRAFGKLQDSIKADTSKELLDKMTATVEVLAPYGTFVEGVFHNGRYGRAPRKWPPIDPIMEWLLVKGFTGTRAELEQRTYLVRRKIGQRGTKAQPFLFPAEAQVRPQFEENVKRIMDHAAREAGLLLKRKS